PQPVELLVAAYVAIPLLSTLWSAAPTLSLVRGVQLLIVAVLASAAVRVLCPSMALWKPCAAAALFTICCATLSATFSWARPVYESHEDRFRFAWFAVHPIEVATVAGIAAVGVIAGILWQRPSRGRAR